MDDEFLQELAKAVRPEFAQALYARLQNIPPRRPKRWIGPTAAIILTVIGIVACATPQIRTPLIEAIETPLAKVVGEPAAAVFRTVSRSGDAEQRVPLQVVTVNIEQAQKEVPFPIRFPEWVPEGLEPTEIAFIAPAEGKIGLLSMGWTKDDVIPLWLNVWWPAGQIRMQADETVEINGQPALFAQEPGASGGLSLTWIQQDEGAGYILTANPEYISKDELLQIAATMR